MDGVELPPPAVLPSVPSPLPPTCAVASRPRGVNHAPLCADSSAPSTSRISPGRCAPPPSYCCPYPCPYCTLTPSLLLPLPVSLLYTLMSSSPLPLPTVAPTRVPTVHSLPDAPRGRRSRSQTRYFRSIRARQRTGRRCCARSRRPRRGGWTRARRGACRPRPEAGLSCSVTSSARFSSRRAAPRPPRRAARRGAGVGGRDVWAGRGGTGSAAAASPEG